MKKVMRWVEERTGWPSIRETLLDRKIPKPGRGGWLYTLGSATLAVFLIQVITGMLLGMNYSPSPDHAYDSIRHIMTSVPMGAFIRGLHHWGASAMIILMVLHLLRIFVMASYKQPRELTWIVGVVLLLLTFGLGFTGYLLPWDQKAYWATAVGVNISAQAPILGPLVATVFKGGQELGALTLTRFYSFHVLVLPALLALVIAIHLFLVVYHGISAPPHPKGTPPPDYLAQKAAGKSFYPYSIFKDMVMVALVVGVLVFLAWHFGAGLEDPADPNDSSYNPRPEWYFLFLFQALKLFPGHLEYLAAIVMPTLLVLILFLIPALDRSPHRHPLARPVWMMIAILGSSHIGYLSYQGFVSPLVNPRIEANPTVLQGKKLYADLHCAYCHQIRGEGSDIGPDLSITVSRRTDEWILDHFRKPAAVVPGTSMPELHLLDEEMYALIAYLRDIGGSTLYSRRGAKIFEEQCEACHKLRGRGEEVGPALDEIGNFRTASFLKSYIQNPQGINPDAAMPEFGSSLTEEDIEHLANYLAAQKGRR